MSDRSSIEWTDATWNPTRGCSLVSEGCRFCYAMKVAGRWPWGRNLVKRDSSGNVTWNGNVELVESALAKPLHWRAPRKVFVDSESDLFHEKVPDEWIDRVFAVMASSSRHTFQVLTKRPERMLAYMERVSRLGGPARERYVAELRAYHMEHLEGYTEGFTLPAPPTPELRALYDSASESERHLFKHSRAKSPLGHGFSGRECHWRKWPLSNVWLGVSVEDQATADARIPLLLQTPAAVRFVSYEPALGPVDFRRVETTSIPAAAARATLAATGRLPSLDWVIVGGESGPHARPFDVAWARSTIAQCKAAGVACFVKQLGALPRGWYRDHSAALGECKTGDWRAVVTHPKGGDMAEWPEDLRVRAFPAVRT